MPTLALDEKLTTPGVLFPETTRPTVLRSVTRQELCDAAEIPLRVTGDCGASIIVHIGTQHFHSKNTLYVGVKNCWHLDDKTRALRILEILAYSFHDYAVRESVCGRGLFCVEPRKGRPPLRGKAMSAKERMRKMRAA
jgi:hypothetical protein